MSVLFMVIDDPDDCHVVRLCVAGAVERGDSDTLSAVIADAVTRDDVTTLLVDLSWVTTLDPAGVRALLDGHATAADRGVRLRLDHSDHRGRGPSARSLLQLLTGRHPHESVAQSPSAFRKPESQP